MKAPESRNAVSPTPPPILQCWSTASVAPSQRLDYYASALTAAVDPMHIAAGNAQSFGAEVTSAELGPIDLVQAKAGEHVCVRDGKDIAHSSARNFHLILNLISTWRLTHRGQVQLQPGEAVLLDSQLGHTIALPAFQIIHLKMPDLWLRQWIPNPTILAGRVIPQDSKWGRALCAFVSQLSPDFVIRAPLPATVVADHVGALLALIAGEIGGAQAPKRGTDRALIERIVEIIKQTCSDVTLSATDVAAEAKVSIRTLHRSLALEGETFGALLLQARTGTAKRMLESALFDRLTVAEIGKRAGFADPSHFCRVYRRLTGRSPGQVRGQLGASV